MFGQKRPCLKGADKGERMTMEQENALLRATLREILRIDEAASREKECISIDDALTGELLEQYRDIRRKARILVEEDA